MSRRYTGWDKNSKSRREGLEKLVDLLEEHFGLWNNGTWSAQGRNKRGKKSPSVHNTGRAADLSWRGAPYRGPGNYEAAVRMMDFLTRPDVAEAFKIEAVFDYYPGPHGRGWKCDRGRWQNYTKKAFGGAPGGDWVHIEIANDHANEPDYINHWFLHFVGQLPATPAPAPAPAPEPAESSPMRSYPGRPVKRGSRGENVKLVQQVIGATPDGSFGPKTEQAVKEWQNANGRLPDGIVGPKTWASMFPG